MVSSTIAESIPNIQGGQTFPNNMMAQKNSQSTTAQEEAERLERITARQEWTKFGVCKGQERGHVERGVTVQEQTARAVYFFDLDKHDPAPRKPKRTISCRYCKGPHFSSRCPKRGQQDDSDNYEIPGGVRTQPRSYRSRKEADDRVWARGGKSQERPSNFKSLDDSGQQQPNAIPSDHHQPKEDMNNNNISSMGPALTIMNMAEEGSRHQAHQNGDYSQTSRNMRNFSLEEQKKFGLLRQLFEKQEQLKRIKMARENQRARSRHQQVQAYREELHHGNYHHTDHRPELDMQPVHYVEAPTMPPPEPNPNDGPELQVNEEVAMAHLRRMQAQLAKQEKEEHHRRQQEEKEKRNRRIRRDLQRQEKVTLFAEQMRHLRQQKDAALRLQQQAAMSQLRANDHHQTPSSYDAGRGYYSGGGSGRQRHSSRVQREPHHQSTERESWYQPNVHQSQHSVPIFENNQINVPQDFMSYSKTHGRSHRDDHQQRDHDPQNLGRISWME